MPACRWKTDPGSQRSCAWMSSAISGSATAQGAAMSHCLLLPQPNQITGGGRGGGSRGGVLAGAASHHTLQVALGASAGHSGDGHGGDGGARDQALVVCLGAAGQAGRMNSCCGSGNMPTTARGHNAFHKPRHLAGSDKWVLLTSGRRRLGSSGSRGGSWGSRRRGRRGRWRGGRRGRWHRGRRGSWRGGGLGSSHDCRAEHAKDPG